jgi:hypothetical protein
MYYAGICLEGLRKTMKTSVSVAGIWDEVNEYLDRVNDTYKK